MGNVPGTAPEAAAASLQGVAALTNHEQWKVFFDIERNQLDRPTITDSQARAVAVNVYHEARHIEQFHKMARMLAGKGRTVAEIVRRMKIPEPVAADAHDSPLKAGTPEFITAEDQFEDGFGAGRARHEQAEGQAILAERALAAARKSGDPAAIARAEARLEAARIQHDQLQNETDAVGAEQTVFSSW